MKKDNEKEELKARIKEKRLEVLDEEFKTFQGHCIPCTKIKKGIELGILKKGTQKDRSNEVCDLCPYQLVMTKAGDKLNTLLQQERRLR